MKPIEPRTRRTAYITLIVLAVLTLAGALLDNFAGQRNLQPFLIGFFIVLLVAVVGLLLHTYLSSEVPEPVEEEEQEPQWAEEPAREPAAPQGPPLSIACPLCNTLFEAALPPQRPARVSCVSCGRMISVGTAPPHKANLVTFVCESCRTPNDVFDDPAVRSYECRNCRHVNPVPEKAEEAPAPKPPAHARRPPVDGEGERPVEEIEGVGPTYGARLAQMEVLTTRDLRAADPDQVATRLDVSATVVRQWQSMSELMTVKGIGPQFAELLVRSGVESVDQLKASKPRPLLLAIHQTEEGRKVAIQGAPIGPKTVERWIRAARVHASKGRRGAGRRTAKRRSK